MTALDAPRAPKPITREQADVLAEMFARQIVGQPEDTNIAAAFYDMLDHGEIVQLDHEEAHALTELLTEVGALPDGITKDCPIDARVAKHLLRAVRKIVFAHGRHYGLTNFDLGIEDD